VFKNTNKKSNIKCRENRRQCRTLPHTYICVTGFRKKGISRVLGRSTYKIVGKEVYNAVCKTKVAENGGKHAVIQRRKELSDIKCNNTCFKTLGLASSNQMSQKYTSILRRPLGHTS